MDEDISLPKSTLSKVIRDVVPGGMRVSGETLELLVACCNEFVHLLSSQSNEISEKEKRATISPDHVLKALDELGFTAYLPDVRAAWLAWKGEQEQHATAAKKRQNTGQGLSQAQLLEMQEQLFRAARARSESGEAPGLGSAAAVPPPAAAVHSGDGDDDELGEADEDQAPGGEDSEEGGGGGAEG